LRVARRQAALGRSSEKELQRLKPLWIGGFYVVAKATTHKDTPVIELA
jgi:hypothetical protein